MKDYKVKHKIIYQYVVLGAMLALQAAYFYVNKELQGELLGALIGVVVGIGIQNDEDK